MPFIVEEDSMTQMGVVVPEGTRLASSEVRKVAGGAAAFSLLLAAIDVFGGSNGGLVGLFIVALLVGVTTLGVFFWAVPWATSLDEPGPSVVALVASILGLLTVVIFWSGLPPVFAAAGIVLAWPARDGWEGRNYARAAVALGVAAIALDVIVLAADLV
jgi:hypothetical protein